MDLKLLAFLLLPLTVNAANWYVRPSSAGAATGADWSNAWSITTLNANWASVNAGDTIWFAGGSYSTSILPTKSGTSANPIHLKRVLSSDTVPASAAGWSSSFDSVVALHPSNASGINFKESAEGSWLKFDGRTNYGWTVTCDDFSAHNGGAVAFKASSGTNGAAPGNVSFNCMDLIGPGMNRSYANNQAVVSIDYGGASDVQFTNCAIHGSPNPVWIAQSYRIVFDKCKIYEADCLNTETIHPNVIDVFGSSVVMRYCELWSWSVEGFQLWGSDVEGAPGCDVLVYGCVFRDTALNIVSGGSGVGRAFIASPNWPPLHRIRAYNNTFADMVSAVGLYYAANRYASNCDIKNNIYWNCNWQSDTAPSARDYDLGSGAGILGAHSISSGSVPFVDYSGKDYNIVTNIGATYPRNKGVALDAIAGETLNLDANGNTRGADGSWDIGAYEYAAGTTNSVGGSRKLLIMLAQ